MNVIAMIFALFAVVGAVDRILGNRFKLGEEFEKGFHIFGPLALSMLGMLVLAPVIANLLRPAAETLYQALHIDPAMIPSLFIANDMGAAALADELASDPALGRFGGLVVASMMGATISFTIPFALENVPKKHHTGLLLGMLCGIATVPLGSFVGGLMMDIAPGLLALNLLPLLIFAAVIAAGLVLFPAVCARVFKAVGAAIRVLVTVGLLLSIITFMTGVEILPGMGKIEDAALVCLNCCVYLSGVFPMMALLSRALKKPLRKLGRQLGVNEVSALGLFACLATNISAFEMMDRMDQKGVLLNAAFSISAAFALADHLAFTMAYDAAAAPAVVIGKLTAGVLAVVLADVLYPALSRKMKGVSS